MHVAAHGFPLAHWPRAVHDLHPPGNMIYIVHKAVVASFAMMTSKKYIFYKPSQTSPTTAGAVTGSSGLNTSHDLQDR